MVLCHLCWKAVSKKKISTKPGHSDDAFESDYYNQLNRVAFVLLMLCAINIFL